MREIPPPIAQLAAQPALPFAAATQAAEFAAEPAPPPLPAEAARLREGERSPTVLIVEESAAPPATARHRAERQRPEKSATVPAMPRIFSDPESRPLNQK